MAKWKSQQYYTIQLQDVLCSIIDLTDDAGFTRDNHWYWDGRRDVTLESRRCSGTITSLTEHVLPILFRVKSGNLKAALPIQSVFDFEKETKLAWQDGLSAKQLISAVRSVYFAR